jgi:hypothetical protein
MSESDTRTLYVVVHNPNGGIGHQQIGQALVEADFDATLTKLALRLGCEPLASFTINSRRQAAAAMQELEELGDVDVDPRDFDPKWFDPLECLATVDRLLEQRGRVITTRVRIELDLLRRILADVVERRDTFYLVEPDPDEDIA